MRTLIISYAIKQMNIKKYYDVLTFEQNIYWITNEYLLKIRYAQVLFAAQFQSRGFTAFLYRKYIFVGVHKSAQWFKRYPKESENRRKFVRQNLMKTNETGVCSFNIKRITYTRTPCPERVYERRGSRCRRER